MPDRPKRKRNYRAEYERRIARGRAKGLSREEAAGHGKRRSERTFRRVFDWLFRPRRRREPPPGPVFGGGSPPRPPRPPAPPASPPGGEPSDQGPEDFEFVRPEDSGIPPDEVADTDDAYTGIGRDLGILDDEFAMQLLWSGWFADVSPDLRAQARDMFFTYTGLAKYEFDWDAWRDWYSATAA